MHNSIKTFAKQFEFKPAIQNKSTLKKYSHYILIGMGGSGLPAKILKTWKPETPLIIHQNYSLPPYSSTELKQSLIICCSHSGTTEEVLDGFDIARKKKLALAVIATGGALLERAQKFNVPYIVIPKTGTQPRMATGLMLNALLALMKENKVLLETQTLAILLKPNSFENIGKNLARALQNSLPIIYASEQNVGIALNWKIKFNETGKVPAFYNILPELNHNEMTGFDMADSTRALSEKLHFIFLEDEKDHPRIRVRMSVTAKLLKQRGLKCQIITLKESSRIHKIFAATVLADWTAYYLSQLYKVNPQDVPMVEEFKKLIKLA